MSKDSDTDNRYLLQADWCRDLAGLDQYFNVLHAAFDHALSVGRTTGPTHNSQSFADGHLG
jgi:hypothetical protein